MIEYSVFTQIDIDRITQAQMSNNSDLEWANAFQDFLNQEAADGWRLVTVQWDANNRIPQTLVLERIAN